jgi:hypothetical protein
VLNFSRLNSARLDGSVAQFALGAALLAAGGTLTVNPVNITPGSATFSTTSTAQASGVRNVFGAATTAGASGFSADGVIAITSGANLTGVSRLAAAYTDAYGSTASSLTANATKIQGAIATMAGTATLSGDAVRMAGTNVAFQVASTFYPDPGIKRSGSNTIEREGPPVALAGKLTFSPDCLRTAYAGAIGESTGTLGAPMPQLIQGARANLTVTFTSSALAALDGAYSAGVSTFTAKGIVAANGQATLASTSALIAAPNNITPAGVARASITGNLSGDPRTALLAQATTESASRLWAWARLAALGSGASYATSDMQAAPWVYRAASAQINAAGSFDATGTCIQSGAALASARATLTASAITNPATPAAPERCMRVMAQPRRMQIQLQPRTMRVA